MRPLLQTMLGGFLMIMLTTLQLDGGEKRDYPRPKYLIIVNATCTDSSGKTHYVGNAKIEKANSLSSELEGRDGQSTVRIALADIVIVSFLPSKGNKGFRPAEVTTQSYKTIDTGTRSPHQGFQPEVPTQRYTSSIEIRTHEPSGKPISIVGRSELGAKTIPLTGCTVISFVRGE